MVMRVSDQQNRPRALRAAEAFLVSQRDIPDGFGIYMALAKDAEVLGSLPPRAKTVILPDKFSYLADGDVVRIGAKGSDVRVLYRRAACHNHFLLTERCNHSCLMCSQPPKNIDDSWIVEDVLAAIPLIDMSTREVGFTGGEPTLLGDALFRILRAMRSYLPYTAVHILSNGRKFAIPEFAKLYADVRHFDMMVGIPLYADVSTIHDYVVQADGAFDETIRGILNLKRLEQKVEIRVVVHRQTYARLPQLAEFLARNLTFVDHVAFMGLEITGFTRSNLGILWIDPADYQDELYRAVSFLADSRMHVSIYNHQLCVLDRRLWPFARKAISDWKNEYMPECEGCREKENCGGFFASAKSQYSDHIQAIY
ncbi:MAG: His-Xaa-Ser system radical SAM maturase HxsC [Candidatus Methylacidiphilaceae bacterium]